MIPIIVVCWCELNYHQGSHTATVGMWTSNLTFSLLLISRSSMALLISAVPQPVQMMWLHCNELTTMPESESESLGWFWNSTWTSETPMQTNMIKIYHTESKYIQPAFRQFISYDIPRVLDGIRSHLQSWPVMVLKTRERDITYSMTNDDNLILTRTSGDQLCI